MPDVTEIVRALAAEGIRARLDEPMRTHTSLRVGGAADCFVAPENEAQIIRTARLCREVGMPLCVIGNGTNLLVSDEGIAGVTMQIGAAFSDIKANGFTVEATCGAPLVSLCRFAAERGLAGLAFAGGIPGTVGGAIVMNAGAYGGEVRDVLQSVRVLDADGEIRTLAAGECGFGYRMSRFQAEPQRILLSAVFALHPGDREEIFAEMRAHNEARRQSQPLDLPNAGSAFRRPADGRAAAQMIDECGLKGTAVGGAAVSEKHAGFFVNRGGATAADFEALLSLVQRRVQEESGVLLEPEYRRLGGRHGSE